VYRGRCVASFDAIEQGEREELNILFGQLAPKMASKIASSEGRWLCEFDRRECMSVAIAHKHLQ
jgi:hypothetical protein